MGCLSLDIENFIRETIEKTKESKEDELIIKQLHFQYCKNQMKEWMNLQDEMMSSCSEVEPSFLPCFNTRESECWKDYYEYVLKHSNQNRNNINDSFSSNKKPIFHIKRIPMRSTTGSNTKKGLSVAGIDIKVHARNCPDDRIYQQSEFARKYLPRGNYLLQVEDHSLATTTYFPLIRAYPKFTGHEDGHDSEGDKQEIELYFVKTMEHSKYVISTSKVCTVD